MRRALPTAALALATALVVPACGSGAPDGERAGAARGGEAQAATRAVGSSRTDRRAAARGARWLRRAVPTGADGAAADTATALRATGTLSSTDRRRRAAALRRGARHYAVTAGAIGKTMLGLTALATDGTCVGRTDLLRRLRRTLRSGRYGHSAFDHALALLGLRAVRAPIPAAAVRTLKRTRGRGGWGFALTGADDVQSTGLVLMALRAAGVPRSDRHVRGAVAWLLRQRTPAGGFWFETRGRNEANATALALLGLRAAGREDRRAARALRGLQQSNGAFRYHAAQAGSLELATIDAVTALSGRTLPVRTASKPGRGCR